MYSKEFNSLDEIQQYYNEESNTYIFKEDGKYIALVVFNFDLNIEANIEARDIKARYINAKNIKTRDINAYDINALDINAGDINAADIKARDIIYHAVCFAYNNIKCKSIKGIMKNSKHFVLSGKLEALEDDK